MPGTFVDENFEGAGEVPGLEIWRIEVSLFEFVKTFICTQYSLIRKRNERNVYSVGLIIGTLDKWTVRK